jgi:hypothetical protein
MRIRTHLFGTLVTLALAALVGCGTPGAPLPPSLELPTPVDDLSASRKGNHVVLTWTPSRRTTDKQNIRHPGPTRVCRVVDEVSITQCSTIVREIPPSEIPAPTTQQPNPKIVYEDTLPASLLSPTGFATYAIEMANNRGRSAGLSSQRRVPLAPTMPPPEALSSTVNADGVAIRWQTSAPPAASSALRFHYRLLRRAAGKGGSFTLVEDVPVRPGTQSVQDKSFEWEQNYDYKLTPVTDVLDSAGQQIAEVEGDDSPVILVAAHDVFPPAQVAGLQAVYSGPGQKPFIDLTWAPSTESDVAGYDIFRHEAGAAPAKINSELAKSPSFRDDNIQVGRKYFYSVRAVDTRGNAGQLSTESSETVPEQ